MRSRSVGTTTPRVLVIYKKSHLEIYVRDRQNPRVQHLLDSNDLAVAHLREAHDDHVQTLAAAKRVLSELKVKSVFRYRSDAGQVDRFDLVVTLGGDGTLLWGSHQVGASIPMVAINTAPKHSVGFYCAGTKDDLGDILADAIRGRLPALELTRMRVEVDGACVANRVLNDALFCHPCPAATARYLIRLGDSVEEQKSSGIWVGPGAGATAAQRSAGGKIFPPTSKRLQFVVREPYAIEAQRYALKRGFIEPDAALWIKNKVRKGHLYLDGPHLGCVIEIGSEVMMRRSSEPLTVLGYHGARADLI
jgi:NAD+ kinase